MKLLGKGWIGANGVDDGAGGNADAAASLVPAEAAGNHSQERVTALLVKDARTTSGALGGAETWLWSGFWKHGGA
jgi:hypothetical protein